MMEGVPRGCPLRLTFGAQAAATLGEMMRVLVFATLGFAVMGCTPTVLSIDDYEATCQANNDCVIVWLGDQCGACSGEHAAVNDDSLGEISADRDAAASACPPWSERFHVECVMPLPAARPVCGDGVCSIPAEGGECSFDDDGYCHGAD